MTTPVWEAGKLYVPGDLVRPISQPAPVPAQLSNGGFTAGATGWTFSGGVIYTATGGYGGGGCCTIPGSQPDGVALADDEFVVPTGQAITAACVIQQGASDVDHTRGWAELQWFNSSDVLLRTDRGNVVNDGRGGAWHASSVTAYAPVGAAYVRAGIGLHQGSNDNVWGDNLTVIGAYAALPNGLIYKAVQADPGYSGSSEPAWPPTLGVTVVDNQVTWEAVTTSRVTWTAEPLLVSGTVEPEWPTQPGAVISDGTIQWECISRRVEDEKCPNTKVVAIMAGKVYAADGDIVHFSATSNPLDWSSQDDAGFLPTGLQQANANDMAVLAPYRANLAAFNASSFQNWQVDPDPAAMAILDQMDGVGSTWPKAATAVGNELFFLAALGVRTVGISAGAENLAAGDVGQPIDSLVQEAMRVTVANSGKALSTYYPSAGQYWLTFPDYPPAELSISGDLADGEGGDVESYQYGSAGGVLPHTFSILSGELPAGLSMSAAGLVTGTRTTAGTYSWVVRVTDADGSTADLSDTSITSADSTPELTGTYQMQMNLSVGVDGAAIGVVPRGAWKLIIGEVNHTTGQLALYSDGVLVDTSAETVSGVLPYDLAVAGTAYSVDDTYQTFRGRLWGVGVANGLLTAAEKSVLWNGGDGISFASLASSIDPDAVSLWAKIIYAWQLDNLSTGTYVDSKGNRNLTKFGTVGHVIDAKFGICLNGTKAGRLVAVGSNAQGLESAVSATYFAWVFSEVLSTDDNPAILTRHNGGSDIQGLRSYWLSD